MHSKVRRRNGCSPEPFRGGTLAHNAQGHTRLDTENTKSVRGSRAPTMPSRRRPTSAPLTSKTQKRYRNDLAAANPPVFVGPAPTKPRAQDSKIPMSASLKANDDGLMRFVRVSREAGIDEGEIDEDAPQLANIKANLRAVAENLAAEGRASLQKAREVAERLEDWGEQSDGSFEFLQGQSILVLQHRGIKYYIKGQGIAPVEDLAANKEEMMDDALVNYMRTAGDLARFRQSSAFFPVASGAFMRPEAPSSEILAKRVAGELREVRNGMFRLETMMNERAERGSSTQTEAFRRESALRKWAKRKQEDQELNIHQPENLQTADEMIALRLRALSSNKNESKSGVQPLTKKKVSTLNLAAWGGALLRLNTGLDTPSGRRVQSARDVRSEWSPDHSHSSVKATQQRAASARCFGGVRGLGSLRAASTSKLEDVFWQVQHGKQVKGQESKEGWASSPKKVVFVGKEGGQDASAEAMQEGSIDRKDENLEAGDATPRLGGVEVKVGGAARTSDVPVEYVKLAPAWGFESSLTQSPTRRSVGASPDTPRMYNWAEAVLGHASPSYAGSAPTRSPAPGPPSRTTYTSVQGHTPRRPNTARARLMSGGGGTVFGGRIGLGALASGHAAMKQVVQERDLKRAQERPQSAYAARARGLVPARPQTARQHASRPSSGGARLVQAPR